jgi:hypothetical protein
MLAEMRFLRFKLWVWIIAVAIVATVFAGMVAARRRHFAFVVIARFYGLEAAGYRLGLNYGNESTWRDSGVVSGSKRRRLTPEERQQYETGAVFAEMMMQKYEWAAQYPLLPVLPDAPRPTPNPWPPHLSTAAAWHRSMVRSGREHWVLAPNKRIVQDAPPLKFTLP